MTWMPAIPRKLDAEKKLMIEPGNEVAATTYHTGPQEHIRKMRVRCQAMSANDSFLRHKGRSKIPTSAVDLRGNDNGSGVDIWLSGCSVGQIRGEENGKPLPTRTRSRSRRSVRLGGNQPQSPWVILFQEDAVLDVRGKWSHCIYWRSRSDPEPQT
jgi:hypothetical protein